MRRAGQGIGPIFAQQSIREMTRTQRTPEQVMADACNAVQLAKYDGPMGADADHLKTPADVDRTAAAGFVFFTIDPSEFVDGQADDYSPAEITRRAAGLVEYAPWLEEYTGKAVTLPTGTKVELTAEAPAGGRQIRQGNPARHQPGRPYRYRHARPLTRAGTKSN